MTISIIYYTRFGDNAEVAERLSEELENLGHGVSIHPIHEARPSEIPSSDLYIVGSPTQIGTIPIKAGKFLKRMNIKPGSHFAVFSTYAEAKSGAAAKMTGIMSDHKAIQVSEPLQLAVKDLKGPLEDGWEEKLKLWAEKVGTQVP